MQAHILVDDRIERTSDVAEIRAAHAAGRRLWLDLEERTTEAVQLLAETFAIHPLVIEDVWIDTSSPKIDHFDHYIYVVLHGLRGTGGIKAIELAELDLLIGDTYVITQHQGSKSIEALRLEIDTTPRLLQLGPAWLAHALIDRVIDRYLPLIAEFDTAIDRIEHEAIERAGSSGGRDMVPIIFSLKRGSQKLSRVVGHQLEILHRLSRGEFAQIPKDALPYYRDVYDHFVRVTDRADDYRDVVMNTLDAYLSVQGARMNETVKTLTLMSTFMLPLSFIASVYGMNFRGMPEISWKYGYLWALSLMVAVALSIVVWFKRKRWL